MVVSRRAKIDVDRGGFDETKVQRIQEGELNRRLCVLVNDANVVLGGRCELGAVEAKKRFGARFVGQFLPLLLNGFVDEVCDKLFSLAAFFQM